MAGDPMKLLRSELSSRAPKGAVSALLVPERALGRSDSDWPDACGLWGFELESGERLEHHPASLQLPQDEILDMLDDQQYESLMAKHQAAQANPPQLYQGRDMNEWLYEVEAEVLEAVALALGQDADADQIIKYPGQFEWDGEAGETEALSPNGASSDRRFLIWRLKLTA